MRWATCLGEVCQGLARVGGGRTKEKCRSQTCDSHKADAAIPPLRRRPESASAPPSWHLSTFTLEPCHGTVAAARVLMRVHCCSSLDVTLGTTSHSEFNLPTSL